MKFRKEFDSLGKISVPSDKYWGASTQRSKKYFDIGEFLVEQVLIKSIAIIKKSPISKYFFDLSVEAPQYLSTGTLIDPILSNSFLVFIILYLSVLVYFLYIMFKYNQIGVIWQILKKLVCLWKHLIRK